SRAAPPSPCRRAPRPPHRSATTTAPTSPLLCPPSSIEARCQPKRARDVAGRRLQRGKGPARPTARSVTPVPRPGQDLWACLSAFAAFAAFAAVELSAGLLLAAMVGLVSFSTEGGSAAFALARSAFEVVSCCCSVAT